MSLIQTWFGQSGDRHRVSSLVDNDTAGEQEVRELLDSIALGNTLAFWSLWGIYKGRLYQVCLWQMNGVREDAEDALSRSMLRALEKLPHANGRIENIGAWLSRLTVNLCVDIHREHKREARRLESIDDVVPAPGDALLAAADSPEDDFLNREAVGYVFGVVNDLPPRLREPFTLRFLQEMDYGDIAEQLILTSDNVRKRIQQARDILRQRLITTCQAGGLAVTPRAVSSDAVERRAPEVRSMVRSHSG
jgi:RNA polymerase sigma-70 factor (ECF subfamily)